MPASMRWYAVWPLLLVGLIACRPGANRPTHVIIVSVDTLNRDALRCYEGSAPPLPALDAFAEIARPHLERVRPARVFFSFHGLPERQVILRHALKPALLPVISYMGPATAALITGSVVIERIYSIPGLGSYFVQGALNRDYTLVMGVVVFYGIVIIALNFIVDLLYAWLNPRIRYDDTQ